MNLLLLAAAMISVGQATPGRADVLGVWVTQDGAARVVLLACAPGETSLCGAIAWLKEPTGDDGSPIKDGRNPDPALRARPVMGLRVLDELRPTANGSLRGRIYDPDSGQSYAGSVWREDGVLRVRGCRMIACRTEVWRRYRSD